MPAIGYAFTPINGIVYPLKTLAALAVAGRTKPASAHCTAYLTRSKRFQGDQFVTLPPLPPIRFARVVSEEFGENTYILHRDGRDDCLVVDPGMDWAKIVDHLERHRLTPAAILITHGHADHIAGNAALKQRWPACQIVVGVEDAPKLTDPVLNLSAGYGFSVVSPAADVTVRDGEVFSAAGIDVRRPCNCRPFAGPRRLSAAGP